MKGINLKKIGAIVAGATILASSVAFAGLTFDNTELVDVNGQPVAKVVLGSKSAASDGVAAGAIAAKLASVAYKKSTLTASATEDAICSAAAGNASGTCTITNEKVSLEVTVPGTTNSGIAEFSTLIADYVDKTTENRYNAGNDDIFSLTESETDINEANPYDIDGGSEIIGTATDLFRVGSDNFGPFASKTITDTDSGDVYTENQFVWISGSTEFDKADTEIESNVDILLYQVKFDESTHTGIPQCTEDEDNDKDWADCTADDPEYTGKHRVKINFLGSEWIIIDLFAPDEVATNEDEVEVGGEVTLAKESIYGIINVGQNMTSSDGQMVIRLDDISTATGVANEHPAVVSFLNANGIVLSQDQIDAGETVKKTIGGKEYKVRVYQTAPGYTFGAKWAEMALIEQELELKDDENLDADLNEDWTVRLLWKNKEGDTGADADNIDALRSILVYSEGLGDPLSAGKSVNVVEDPVAYKLTYKGLDLKSTDYDTLKYETGGNLDLTIDADQEDEIANSLHLDSGEYVKVKTDVTDGFKFTGNELITGTTITGKGKEFYYTIAPTDATDVDVIDGYLDIDNDGAAVPDAGDDGYVITDAGVVYEVINGAIDANRDGAITAADDIVNLVFDGNDFGAGNDDVRDGRIDVDDDGDTDADDDIADLTSETVPAGMIVIKKGSTGDWVVMDTDVEAIAGTLAIEYKTAGTSADTADGGVILFDDTQAGAARIPDGKPVIALYEDIGDYEAATGSDDHATGVISVSYNILASSFADRAGGQDDEITFDNVANPGAAPVADLRDLGYVLEGTTADYDEGEFISPRGSKFESMSSSAVQFKVAKKIGHVDYEFATNEASNVSASTTLLSLAEGQTGTVGDVTIKVKEITETVGACTATGGSATCTVPKDQIKAVIMPNNAASVDAIIPFAGLNANLVVLDKDATATTGVLITIGGNAVNTVTADALAGAGIDFAQTPVVVKQIGNKIVVAGLTAQDTLTAKDQFLAALKAV